MPHSVEAYAEKVRRNKERSLKARDIAPLLHAPKHPRRVSACKRNLVRFCETYLKHIFSAPFSHAHIEALRIMERAILGGAQWPALFLPRGFGKTSLMQAAALWALIYGHRKFVFILGANQSRAEDLLRGIVIELSSNDELEADFPHLCIPIREIQGSRQRALNQNIEGVLTRIEASKERFILPWVKSKSGNPLPFANSIVRAAGLGAAIRGARHVLANGVVIRPDLVLIDDPQTDELAHSPSQVSKLTSLLLQSIAGLAGPGSSLTVILSATVIAPDDLAERIINGSVSVQFTPIRFSLLNKLPPNELIEEYRTVRAQALREGNPQLCNEWWQAHREELERDIECIWPAYRRANDVSAIQTAVNIFLDDPTAFACEIQNDPELLRKQLKDRYAQELETRHLLNCIIPIERGIPPAHHQFIHAHIDVHETLLYYVVLSVDRESAHIVDYGTFPEQHGTVVHREPTISIKHVFGTQPAAIARAVAALIEELRARTFNGRHVDAITVDTAWGSTSVMLRQMLAAAKYAGFAFAANGIARRPTQTQISDWKVRPGELHGPGFRFGRDQYGPRFTYDTNFFKCEIASLVHSQKLTIYEGSEEQHALLFSHLRSEVPVVTTFNGRQFVEWIIREGVQNHLFDCVVCAWASSRVRYPQAVIAIPQNRTEGEQPHTSEKNESTIPESTTTNEKRKKHRVRPLFS